MSKPDYSISTNIRELECPWCGEKGIVDYEDFEDGNGAESDPDHDKYRLKQILATAQNKDALQTNNKEEEV